MRICPNPAEKALTMIRFACACGKKYQVDDSLAGRTARCKACAQPMTVPLFVPAVDSDPIHVSLYPKRKTSSGAQPWFLTILAVMAALALAPSLALEEPTIEVVAILWAFYFLFLLALVGPGMLSRLRALSVGRWLIMAVVSGILAVVLPSLTFIQAITSEVVRAHAAAAANKPLPGLSQVSMTSIPLSMMLGAVLGIGVVGCLIAAAIHPKYKV
jgi:hypothetical protein